MNKTNIDSLDLMKIMASFLVVGIHSELFLTLDSKFHLQLLMLIARLAVPLFFISSSFFLARHLYLHKDSDFAIFNYAKRILQLYLFWLVGYGYFIIKATLDSIKMNGWLLQNLVKGILCFFLSGPRTMLLGWYLNASLFGAVFVYYWFRKKKLLGIVLALLMFILIVIFSAYVPLRAFFQIQTSFFVGPLYFYVGELLFWLYRHNFHPKLTLLVPVVFIIGLIAYYEITVVNALKANSDQLFSYPILAGLLFILFLNIRINLPHARWLRNLATYMYLSHYLLMKIFYNFLYFQIHDVITRYLVIIFLVILSYLLILWLQRYRWTHILVKAY